MPETHPLLGSRASAARQLRCLLHGGVLPSERRHRKAQRLAAHLQDEHRLCRSPRECKSVYGGLTRPGADRMHLLINMPDDAADDDNARARQRNPVPNTDLQALTSAPSTKPRIRAASKAVSCAATSAASSCALTNAAAAAPAGAPCGRKAWTCRQVATPRVVSQREQRTVLQHCDMVGPICASCAAWQQVYGMICGHAQAAHEAAKLRLA